MRRHPHCVFALLLLFLTFAIPVAVNAQALTPLTVKGTVVDIDGAAVPNATITITVQGQIDRSVKSNELGCFSVTLPTGQTEFRATAPGFDPTVQVFRLDASNSEIQLIMAVAGATAVVTITDTAGTGPSLISTATKTLTSLRDIPQSVSIVTQEQMREQSLASVAEVVNYVPGISSHQGENNRDQLVIRGNSTSADFFLNGVRDDVQYFRDLYNVDRVEALKGPNSMTFGRGGGGGVVNRVTKQAGFTSLREITAQFGSFGDKRFGVDFDQPINTKFAARLNSMFESSGSFRQFVNMRRYGINPTVTIVAGPKTAINLSYEYFNDHRVAERGVPSFHGVPVNTPIQTFFGDPKKSLVRATVNLASASIEHEFGRLNFHNRTLLGDYDRFYQNYVPGAVTSDQTRVALSAYNNATRRKNFFNQTDLSFHVNTWAWKHQVLSGTELGRQQTRNFRNTGFFRNASTTTLVALQSPTIDIPITFRQSATDANNQIVTNLGAGYVQDQMELSRHLQIIAGLRFDYFDLHFHNNRTGESLRRTDRPMSPRLGVVFKPVQALSVYANYSSAFLPSSGDQFSSLTTVTQQVKPEKFSNYEIGAKWDLTRNLFFTTALYRQERTNTRATDPADPTRILQTGSQRTNGMELEINGRLNSRWTITGGYAYQDAFIRHATIAAKAGARVALVPRQSFSFWNNYKFFARLSAGVGVIRHASTFASVDNTVTLPAYTRVDAGLFVTLSERWRAQVNLQNLLNRRYFINADGNNNISPGAPLTTRISLVARF